MSSGQPVEVPAEEGSVGEGEIFGVSVLADVGTGEFSSAGTILELNLLFALKVEKDSVHKEI